LGELDEGFIQGSGTMIQGTEEEYCRLSESARKGEENCRT
jgi:hypothetical protein